MLRAPASQNNLRENLLKLASERSNIEKEINRLEPGKVKNPSEEKDVVKITYYVHIRLEFTARESLVLISVSLALKSWWRPSVTFSITGAITEIWPMYALIQGEPYRLGYSKALRRPYGTWMLCLMKQDGFPTSARSDTNPLPLWNFGSVDGRKGAIALYYKVQSNPSSIHLLVVSLDQLRVKFSFLG
ncbi:hypothetical protein EJB05_55086, partial [Eragrostis curvula]